MLSHFFGSLSSFFLFLRKQIWQFYSYTVTICYFLFSIILVISSILTFFFNYSFNFFHSVYLIFLGFCRVALKWWKIFKLTWPLWKKISVLFLLPFLPCYFLFQFLYYLYFFYFWCLGLAKLLLRKLTDQIYKTLDAVLLFFLLILQVSIDEEGEEFYLGEWEQYDEFDLDSADFFDAKVDGKVYYDYLQEVNENNRFISSSSPLLLRRSRMRELLSPNEEFIYTDMYTTDDQDDGLALRGEELSGYEDLPQGVFPALADSEQQTRLAGFSWFYPRFFMDEEDILPYLVVFYATTYSQSLKYNKNSPLLEDKEFFKSREIWESGTTSNELLSPNSLNFWMMKQFSFEVFNNIDFVERRKDFLVEDVGNLVYKITHKGTKEIFYIDFVKFFDVMRSVNFSTSKSFELNMLPLSRTNYVQFLYDLFLDKEVHPIFDLKGNIESDNFFESNDDDAKTYQDFGGSPDESITNDIANLKTSAASQRRVEAAFESVELPHKGPWASGHLSFLKKYFGLASITASGLKRGLDSPETETPLRLEWDPSVRFRPYGEPDFLNFTSGSLTLTEFFLISSLCGNYGFSGKEAKIFFEKFKKLLFTDLKLKKVRVSFFFVTNKKVKKLRTALVYRRRSRLGLTFKSLNQESRIKFRKFINEEFPLPLLYDARDSSFTSNSDEVDKIFIRFNSNRVTKVRTHLPFLRKFTQSFKRLHNRRFKHVHLRLNVLQLLSTFVLESYSMVMAKHLTKFLEDQSPSILSKKFNYALSNNDYKQRKYLYWDPKLAKLQFSRLGFSKKAFLKQAKLVSPMFLKGSEFIEGNLDQDLALSDITTGKVENFLKVTKLLSWTNLVFYNFFRHYYFTDRRANSLFDKKFNFFSLQNKVASSDSFSVEHSYSYLLNRISPSYGYALELSRLANYLPDKLTYDQLNYFHDVEFKQIFFEFSGNTFTYDATFERLRKVNFAKQSKYLKKFDDYKRLLNLASSNRLYGLHYLNFASNASGSRQLVNFLLFLNFIKKSSSNLTHPSYMQLTKFVTSPYYQRYMSNGTFNQVSLSNMQAHPIFPEGPERLGVLPSYLRFPINTAPFFVELNKRKEIISNTVSPFSVAAFTGSKNFHNNLPFSRLSRFYYMELLRHYQYLNRPFFDDSFDRPFDFPHYNKFFSYLKYNRDWKNFSLANFLAFIALMVHADWHIVNTSNVDFKPDWNILENAINVEDSHHEVASYFSAKFELIYEYFDLLFGSFLFKKFFFKLFFFYLYLTDFWGYVLLLNNLSNSKQEHLRSLSTAMNVNSFSSSATLNYLISLFFSVFDFFRSRFFLIKSLLFSNSFYFYLNYLLTYFTIDNYKKLYRTIIVFYVIYFYYVLVETFYFLKPKFIKLIIFVFYVLVLYLIFDISDLFEFFVQYITYLYYYYLNLFLFIRFAFMYLLNLGDLVDYLLLYKQSLLLSNNVDNFFTFADYFKMVIVVTAWFLLLPIYIPIFFITKVITFFIVLPVTSIFEFIFFWDALYRIPIDNVLGTHGYSFGVMKIIFFYPALLFKTISLPLLGFLTFLPKLSDGLIFIFGFNEEGVFTANYYYSMLFSVANFLWLFFTDNFIQVNYVYSSLIIIFFHLNFFFWLVFSTIYLWLKYIFFYLMSNPITFLFFNLVKFFFYFFLTLSSLVFKFFYFFFNIAIKFFIFGKSILWFFLTVLIFLYNLSLSVVTSVFSFLNFTPLADFFELIMFTPDKSNFEFDFFYQFSQSFLHNFIYLFFFIFGFLLDLTLSLLGFDGVNIYVEMVEFIPNLFRMIALQFNIYFYILDFRSPEFNSAWDLNHYQVISDIYFVSLYIYFLVGYIYLFGLQPYIYYTSENRDLTVDPELAWYRLNLDDVFWNNLPSYLRELRGKTLYDLTVNHPQLFNEFLGLYDDSNKYFLEGMVDSDAATSFAFDSAMFSFKQDYDEFGLPEYDIKGSNLGLLDFFETPYAASEGYFITHDEFLHNDSGSFNLLEYLEDLLSAYFYSSAFFPGFANKNSKFFFFQKLFFTTTKQSSYFYDFSANRWFSELYNYYILSSEFLPYEEFFNKNEEEDFTLDTDDEYDETPDDSDGEFEFEDEQTVLPFNNFEAIYPYSETDHDSLSEVYFYFKVLNFSEIWLKRRELYRNFLFKKSTDSNLKLSDFGSTFIDNKEDFFLRSQLNSEVAASSDNYYGINYFGSSSSKYVMTSNSFNYVVRSKIINNPFLLKNNKFLRFYFTTISDIYTRELFFFFDYHSNALGSMFSNPLVFWIFLCFPSFSLYLYRTSLNDSRLSFSTADYINFFVYTPKNQALWKYNPALKDLTDLSSYYFFYEDKVYEANHEAFFRADKITGKKKLFMDASMEANKAIIIRSLVYRNQGNKHKMRRSSIYRKFKRRKVLIGIDIRDLTEEYYWSRKHSKSNGRGNFRRRTFRIPRDVTFSNTRSHRRTHDIYNYVQDYINFKNSEEFTPFLIEKFKRAAFASPDYGRAYKDYLRHIDNLRRSRELLKLELEELLKLNPEKMKNSDAIELLNKWWSLNAGDDPSEFTLADPIQYYETTKTIRYLLTLPHLYKMWSYKRWFRNEFVLPQRKLTHVNDGPFYLTDIDKSLPYLPRSFQSKKKKSKRTRNYWFKKEEVPEQFSRLSKYTRALVSWSSLKYVNDWGYAKKFDKDWQEFIEEKNKPVELEKKTFGSRITDRVNVSTDSLYPFKFVTPVNFLVSKEPNVLIDDALVLDDYKLDDFKKLKPESEHAFKGSVLTFLYDLPEDIRSHSSGSFAFDTKFANWKTKLRLLKDKGSNLTLADRKLMLSLMEERIRYMDQSFFAVEKFLNNLKDNNFLELKPIFEPGSFEHEDLTSFISDKFTRENIRIKKATGKGKTKKLLRRMFKPQLFDKSSEYFLKFDSFMKGKFSPNSKTLNIVNDLYKHDDGIKNRLKGERSGFYSKRYKTLPFTRQKHILDYELNDLSDYPTGWEDSLSDKEIENLHKRFVPRRKFIGSPYTYMHSDKPYDMFFSEALTDGSISEQNRVKPFYPDHFFFIRKILYTTLSDFRSERTFLSYLYKNSPKGRVIKRRTKILDTSQWSPYYKYTHRDERKNDRSDFFSPVRSGKPEHPIYSWKSPTKGFMNPYIHFHEKAKLTQLGQGIPVPKDLPYRYPFLAFKSAYFSMMVTARPLNLNKRFHKNKRKFLFHRLNLSLLDERWSTAWASWIKVLIFDQWLPFGKRKYTSINQGPINRHEFINNYNISYSFPYGRKYVLNFDSKEYPIAFPINVYHSSKFNINLNEQFLSTLDEFTAYRDWLALTGYQNGSFYQTKPTRIKSKRKLFKLRKAFAGFDSYKSSNLVDNKNKALLNSTLLDLGADKSRNLSVVEKIANQRLAAFDRIRFEPYLGREPNGHFPVNENALENYFNFLWQSKRMHNSKSSIRAEKTTLKKSLLEILPHDILRSEANFSYWDIPYEQENYSRSFYSQSRFMADTLFKANPTRKAAIQRHQLFKNLILHWKHVPEDIKYSEVFLNQTLTNKSDLALFRLRPKRSLYVTPNMVKFKAGLKKLRKFQIQEVVQAAPYIWRNKVKASKIPTYRNKVIKLSRSYDLAKIQAFDKKKNLQWDRDKHIGNRGEPRQFMFNSDLIGRQQLTNLFPFLAPHFNYYLTKLKPNYDLAGGLRENEVSARRKTNYLLRNIPFEAIPSVSTVRKYKKFLKRAHKKDTMLKHPTVTKRERAKLQKSVRKMVTALDQTQYGSNQYNARRYLRSLAFELGKEPISSKYNSHHVFFKSPIFSPGINPEMSDYAKRLINTVGLRWIAYFDNKDSLLLFKKLFRRRYWSTYSNKKRHQDLKHFRKRSGNLVVDADLELFDFASIFNSNPGQEHIEQKYGYFYSQDATSIIEADLDLLVSDPFYRSSVYHNMEISKFEDGVADNDHEIDLEVDGFWSLEFETGFTFFQVLAFNIIRFFVSSGMLDLFLRLLQKLDLILYHQSIPDNVILQWWSHRDTFLEKDLKYLFLADDNFLRVCIGVLFWWVGFLYNLTLYWPYYFLKKILLYAFAPFFILFLFLLSFSNFFSYLFGLIFKLALHLKLLYLIDYIRRWLNYYYLHILSNQTINRRYTKLAGLFSRFFKLSRGDQHTFSSHIFKTFLRTKRFDFFSEFEQNSTLELSKVGKKGVKDDFFMRQMHRYHRNLNRSDTVPFTGINFYYLYVKGFILNFGGYLVTVYRFWTELFDTRHKQFLAWFVHTENRFFKFFFFPYFKQGTYFENELLKYIFKRVDTVSSNEELFNLFIKFRQSTLPKMFRAETLRDWGWLHHGSFRKWHKRWNLRKGYQFYKRHDSVGFRKTILSKKPMWYRSAWDRIYSFSVPQLLPTSLRSFISLKHLDTFFQGFSKNIKMGYFSFWYYRKAGYSLTGRFRWRFRRRFSRPIFIDKLFKKARSMRKLIYPDRLRRYEFFGKDSWLSNSFLKINNRIKGMKARRLFRRFHRTSRTLKLKFNYFLYNLQEVYSAKWLLGLFTSSSFGRPLHGYLSRKFKRILNHRIVFKNVYSMSWLRYRFYKHFFLFSYLYYLVPRVFRVSIFFFYFLLYEYLLLVLPFLNILLLLLFLYFQKFFIFVYLFLKIFYYLPYVYIFISNFFYSFLFFYFFDSFFIVLNVFNYTLEIFNGAPNFFSYANLILLILFIFKFFFVSTGAILFELSRFFTFDVIYSEVIIFLPFLILQLFRFFVISRAIFSLSSLLFFFIIFYCIFDEVYLQFLNLFDLYVEFFLLYFISMSGFDSFFFFFLVFHPAFSVLFGYLLMLVSVFYSYINIGVLSLYSLFASDNVLFFFMCLKLSLLLLCLGFFFFLLRWVFFRRKK